MDTRICKDCGATKPIAEFLYRLYRGADATLKRRRCKDCTRKIDKAYLDKHPRKRQRNREYCRQWRKDNLTPERNRLYRDRMLAKPGKRESVARRQKAVMLWHNYRMTLEEYDWMMAASNGLCAICNKPNRQNRPLVIDHCHRTGKIRGVLCDHCNVGLGRFDDDAEILRRAIAYLGKYPGATPEGFDANPDGAKKLEAMRR